MDIRKLAPQTQQTLKRLDFNRDNLISVRELSFAKDRNGQLLGVAPQDQALLKSALNKAKGQAAPIVSLIQEASLPPGVRPPAPLFQETAKPSQAAAAEDDSEDESEKNTGLTLAHRRTAGEGNLQTGGEFSATYALPGLSVDVTADTSSLFRGQDGGVGDVSFNAESRMGALTLSASKEMGPEKGGLKGVSTAAELGLFTGFGLKAELSPALTENRRLGWSALALGSTHQWGGLSLNPKLSFEDTLSKPTYGASLSYEFGSGLRLEAEADSTRNLRVGGGFFTRF